MIGFIKRVRNAMTPSKPWAHDPDLALYASETTSIEPGGASLVRTGLEFSMPDLHALLLRPTLAMWTKGVDVYPRPHNLRDNPTSRPEVLVAVRNHHHRPLVINAGEQVAQALVVPVRDFPWSLLGTKHPD